MVSLHGASPRDVNCWCRKEECAREAVGQRVASSSCNNCSFLRNLNLLNRPPQIVSVEEDAAIKSLCTGTYGISGIIYLVNKNVY